MLLLNINNAILAGFFKQNFIHLFIYSFIHFLFFYFIIISISINFTKSNITSPCHISSFYFYLIFSFCPPIVFYFPLFFSFHSTFLHFLPYFIYFVSLFSLWFCFLFESFWLFLPFFSYGLFFAYFLFFFPWGVKDLTILVGAPLFFISNAF